MKVLVVIPAYNEELNLKSVVKDIKTNTNYDYIIVNDCSKDKTLELCKKEKFNCLSLPVNYGLASAVQVGFKYALKNDYDVVIQFDGDGQHEAKYLEKLVKEIENGNDVVIGSRFVETKKPYSARMIGSRLISFLIRVTTGKKITDPTSGFRAYAKDIIPEYANNINYPPEPDSKIYKCHDYNNYVLEIKEKPRKKKIKEVQVTMKERKFGESYLNRLKSIEYMLRVCVSILFIQIFRKR